jgi:KDO2-lipid IV(A) lauroyltransferase
MLSELSARNTTESEVPERGTPARPAWWVRLLARIPFSLLYGFASLLGWLSVRVYPYRLHVVRENLIKAFPDYGEAQLRAVIAGYYLSFAQMLIEVIKAASMPPAEIRRRVRIVNLELARDRLDQGQSLLLVAAHQCNWEWMLLALSLELGYPLDAAYKPLVDSWAEREMKKLRTRFGSRLVPAKDLLADIIKRRGIVRAVAMVADQEPTTSEHMHWTRFLNRDTAFYMGPEELARVTRFPTFFIGLKRTGRGHYEMQFTPLWSQGEVLAPGALTERYARLVEAQIRAAPADWPWSHKRWKLKRSLYESRTRPGG